ncbi:MAG: type II secretion system protein GspJ [Gemmataceae bacterium]|nr:type II secretion system protein GspJ [Gemmataceae bacterium]
MRARKGFTLLEMILALAIGLLLMAALSWMFSTQIQQSQTGREIVEDGTLARSIFTRIANDIVGNLGPVDPRVLPPPGATAAPPATEETTDTTTTDPAAMNETVASDPVYFNKGVQGSADTLVLSVGRVPRELFGLPTQAQDAMQVVSDLRQISYWIAPDNKGLARQELAGVTGQDVDTAPLDIGNPAIVAPEVKSIAFRYFDGVNWNEEWNGNEVVDVETGATYGPPSAIEITIEIVRRNLHGEESSRKFTHVVVIPAGNNFPQTAP